MSQWVLAFLAAFAVAIAAWKARTLTRDGAIAAALVGGIVFARGGLEAAILLLLFFVSSSLLSRLNHRAVRSERSSRQVLANGSVAAVACASFGYLPGAQLAFLGALAAATADTWATELGMRFGGVPRSLISRRPRSVGVRGT